MKRFEWMTPDGIAHAARAATATVANAMPGRSGEPAPDATVRKAGGIDLLDRMKEGLLSAHRPINLHSIPGLDRIEPQEGGLRIGPNVTPAQRAAHETVRARCCALADAAGPSGRPQIRHRATVGGNLLQRPRCWYLRSRAHHCARKGATPASPSTARTSTTRSSITADVPAGIRPPVRRRWSHSVPHSRSPAPRMPGAR